MRKHYSPEETDKDLRVKGKICHLEKDHSKFILEVYQEQLEILKVNDHLIIPDTNTIYPQTRPYVPIFASMYILGYSEISDLNHEQIQTMLNLLCEPDRYSYVVINQVHEFFRLYFEWLHSIGQIDIADSPMNQPYKLGGRPSRGIATIPEPEIFGARARRGVDLQLVAMFELLLSTGIRSKELFQVRPIDFKFNSRPKDMSRGGAPSAFYTGKLLLDPAVHVIKNRRPRIVYISRAANTALQLYMKTYGFKTDSKLPLFPLSRNLAKSRFQSTFPIDRDNPMAQKIIDDERSKPRNFEEEMIEAQSMSESYQVMLAKKIEEIKKENFNEVFRSRGSYCFYESKQISFHMFRHTAACVMYFRSPFGRSYDAEAVRRILGHTSLEQTIKYIESISYISSLSIWKKIVLGGSRDWPLVKKKEYKRGADLSKLTAAQRKERTRLQRLAQKRRWRKRKSKLL